MKLRDLINDVNHDVDIVPELFDMELEVHTQNNGRYQVTNWVVRGDKAVLIARSK